MCGEHTRLSLSYPGCASRHWTLQFCQLQQVSCRKIRAGFLFEHHIFPNIFLSSTARTPSMNTILNYFANQVSFVSKIIYYPWAEIYVITLIITYLLPTTVTAQQSPCFMSGGPEEGSTTPGSMRSWGKQNVPPSHSQCKVWVTE